MMQRLTSPGSRFTAAAVVSFTGDWLTTVALATVLYKVIGNAGPACYMMARVLPRPFGALLGGRVAQKIGARRAALTTIGMQVLLAALLLVVVVIRQPVLILGVVVIQQLAGSALVPSIQALIPHVVEPNMRARLLARNALAVGVSVVIGPPIGALLLALTSPALTILADGVSFVVAFMLLATLATSIQAGGSEARVSRRIRAWLTVREDPALAGMAVGMVGCYATVTALQASLVLASVLRIGSAAGVGLLYSAVGAGAVLGSLYARRRPSFANCISICMGAEMLAVIGLTQTTSVPLSLLFLAGVAAAGSLVQVGCGVVVMQRVDRSSLAAVNGVVFACGYAGMGLGAIAALAGAGLRWETPVLLLACVTVGVLSVCRLMEKRPRGRNSSASRDTLLAASR